jgi:GNAT superfamily N-acetyltransferase
MAYSGQVFKVINAAYSRIHGFVPLTEQQIQFTLKKFSPVILPDFTTAVLDENGQMVGFQIAMPTLSRAFQKAKGRMFPFGFIHIAKAIKKPKKIDILLFGVIPEFQNKGVNSFLMHELTQGCLKNRIHSAESNGMLEENFKMLNFQRYFDAIQHKRRRLFYKSLTP